MGKKILFAVMALLVMATGKIWAQTPYALLCPNEGGTTYSMHFVYTTATVNTGGSGEITVEIEGGSSGSSDPNGGSDKIIRYTKAWEINPANTGEPAWYSATEKGSITQVVFEKSFKDFNVTNCNNWFEGFTSLAEIKDIKNLNTSAVTYMANMFNGCSSLKSLDLSSFDTSGAANTISMFQDCSSLEKITFGNNFKTKNTESMFYGCNALESLNLSSFNTSKVTDMDNMFYGCKNLRNLTLGSFDMTSVTSMYNMFYNCNNITINGNALVFVKSEQKNIWNGITGVRLMVKKDDEDKYVSDGTVDITLNNDKDTPVIFPYNFTANSVTFTRTFTKGNPHTVCLPFVITNTADYGTFYELSGYDNGKVKFTKVEGATKANKPYLFIPDKNKADVTKIEVKGDVDISSTISETYTSNASNDSNTRFCGVYMKKTFTEQDLGGWCDFYGWTADGDFKKAGAGASVGPCRAYIMLEKETTGGSAPARLSVEFDDGETTGIDTIGTAVSTADGGADAPMYNLQGQRVSGGYKGVVIKNGKKMIVR